MIVRWGLDRLPGVLQELGADRPFLIASDRWSGLDLGVDPAARWSEVPSERLEGAAAAARAADADLLIGVGGGSAIDTAKGVSAESGLRLVSVPTTYAGAEWTRFFGIRAPDRRARGGGAGANLAGAVYDVDLTLDLPRAESGGTALNALAHCAEALYVRNRAPGADEDALGGARLIASALPTVLAQPGERAARSQLLAGALLAGRALGRSGLALGHAMAQAVGGRYGLPHGAMNAICLPAALRFNASLVPEAIARFAAALGTDDAAGRIEELARLAGIGRLRDLGVPEDDLAQLSEEAAARPGNQANPRPATSAELEELLRSVW
jgi:alcohol dehydrogenase class IV